MCRTFKGEQTLWSWLANSAEDDDHLICSSNRELFILEEQARIASGSPETSYRLRSEMGIHNLALPTIRDSGFYETKKYIVPEDDAEEDERTSIELDRATAYLRRRKYTKRPRLHIPEALLMRLNKFV